MDKSPAEQILNTAAKIFAEKGFVGGGVSLAEIANVSGVAIAVISERFGRVEMLYEATLECQFGKYAAKMDAVFNNGGSPMEKVELFAKAMQDVHKQDPHFFPLFYRELLNPSPFFESVVVKYIRHVAYLSDNNNTKGIQKGQFKRGIHPAYATIFLAGMFHYYFLASRLAGSLLPPPDDEEYLSQALKLFLSGLKKEA